MTSWSFQTVVAPEKGPAELFPDKVVIPPVTVLFKSIFKLPLPLKAPEKLIVAPPLLKRKPSPVIETGFVKVKKPKDLSVPPLKVIVCVPSQGIFPKNPTFKVPLRRDVPPL